MTKRYIDRLSARPTCKGNIGGWKERHMAAIGGVSLAHLDCSATLEQAIVYLIKGWLRYADSHKARYDSGIGDDGVLGLEWCEIGKCLRGLLNGELGRLDGGTLDSVICSALTDEGFDPNL